MKNYINYRILVISVILIYLGTSQNSYSQEKKYEISISLGGPFSFPSNNVGPGQSVPGNGFNAGLRYSYYLNEGLSIGIGAEYQTYNASLKIQSLAGEYAATDYENEAFLFRYKLNGLREEQKLGYVNIPVNIQFETSGDTKLYLAAGAKIGFAVSGTHDTTIQNSTTSGFYPQYNVELFSPTFAGFASTDNIKSKGDLDTEISYSATVETGVKQRIGDKSAIYVGLYLDYGLNNIYDKTNDKHLVQYNPAPPVNLQYNTVANSAYAGDMILISYGIKLRFAMR
jgi:hypothetical protein